jgi:hypothetical protein
MVHLRRAWPPWSAPAPRKSRIKTSFSLGKYLVSPLTQRLSDGRWSSAVSIRTGRGAATHDRILRFVPIFDTPHDARAYAAGQAQGWLGAAAGVPA